MNGDRDTLANDLLNGVPEISEFLGWKPRKVYHELCRGNIPGEKLGNSWTSTKTALRARFAGLVQQAKAHQELKDANTESNKRARV